jgi:hypothetical protein
VDLIRRQPAHSIRARGRSAVHRGRMYGCNLYLETATQEGAWHRGASMYEPAAPTSRTYYSLATVTSADRESRCLPAVKEGREPLTCRSMAGWRRSDAVVGASARRTRTADDRRCRKAQTATAIRVPPGRISSIAAYGPSARNTPASFIIQWVRGRSMLLIYVAFAGNERSAYGPRRWSAVSLGRCSSRPL